MENISKYLEDKRFISWIFNSNDELEKWWKSYETGHPNEKQNIQLARKILYNIKTTDKQLSDEEKILLFSGILKQVEEQQNAKRKFKRLTGILKYAAVAILFFAVGALLFYRQDNFNPQFYTQKLAEPYSGNESKLIRPDGEAVLLQEQNSVIEYRNNGQVVINNKVLNTTKRTQKSIPDLSQIVIPYGKTSEVLLSDGTKVYLNAGSRLVYPEFFADKNREIFLVGEAFFDVKHDKQHPFIVQTPDIRIKVLGTKFNISAYPSDNMIETVLTEGEVQLKQNSSGFFSETTVLEPSQLAAFNKISKQFNTRSVDTDNYTLWKEGLFKFESTDLSRIVKKLERYYNIHFAYNNPLLGTIKISGKLALADNREEVINRLAVAASVNIEKKGENYYEIN